MELGGNAPFIVFDDADLDAAVEGAMLGQDAQHGRGLHRGQPLLRPRLRRRRVRRPAGRADGGADGRPRHRRRRRGRPADRRGRAATRSPSWSATPSRSGATVRAGGDAVDGPGCFYPPTVLTGVPLDARLMSEEIFGPVAPISAFDTETRPSPRPTTPSSAWSPTSSPRTSTARCGSARRWSPAWSGSTRARLQPRRPLRRRQAVRPRPRGRPRRHRRVPGDQVRRRWA